LAIAALRKRWTLVAFSVFSFGKMVARLSVHPF